VILLLSWQCILHPSNTETTDFVRLGQILRQLQVLLEIWSWRRESEETAEADAVELEVEAGAEVGEKRDAEEVEEVEVVCLLVAVVAVVAS